MEDINNYFDFSKYIETLNPILEYIGELGVPQASLFALLLLLPIMWTLNFVLNKFEFQGNHKKLSLVLFVLAYAVSIGFIKYNTAQTIKYHNMKITVLHEMVLRSVQKYPVDKLCSNLDFLFEEVRNLCDIYPKSFHITKDEGLSILYLANHIDIGSLLEKKVDVAVNYLRDHPNISVNDFKSLAIKRNFAIPDDSFMNKVINKGNKLEVAVINNQKIIRNWEPHSFNAHKLTVPLEAILIDTKQMDASQIDLKKTD